MLNKMTKHKIISKKVTKTSLVGQLVLGVAILEPLSTVPQIIDIYTTRDVASLSLLSWVFFIIGASIWLAYGIKIKNLPLIISSALWVATELILIIGILIYS